MSQKIEIDKPKETSLLRNEIISLLIKVGLLVLAGFIFFTFMFGVYKVRDNAMSPAISFGDYVIYYRLDKRYKVQDSVMVRYEGEESVLRVIATAGDTVDITKDGLVINGALQQEYRIYESTQQFVEGIRFPITIGEGEIFVLGDARENATDSRIYGSIRVSDTLGKVIMTIRNRNI